MSTTTAKIAALNKTENTGVTPELARKLYDKLGLQQIAIVNFASAERTEGVDDSHSVKLEIRHVEPATDKVTDEYLRELQRALYRKRNPQPALTAKDSTEPGVKGLVINGEVHLHCPSCNTKYDTPNVAHAPGTQADGYPPCSYRQCGHVVELMGDRCTRDHDGAA